RVPALIADEIGYFFHLWRINKGALYPYQVAPCCQQHITPTDQLICTPRIKDGARIDFGKYPERQSCREIGLNCSGNNIYRWPLRSDNQVNTYRTRQLSQPGNRCFHLLTRCHHKVCKLIDDQHNEGKKPVSLF